MSICQIGFADISEASARSFTSYDTVVSDFANNNFQHSPLHSYYLLG